MIKTLTFAKSTKKYSPNFFSLPLILIFLLLSLQLFAQIPAGYYDAASGQSGDQLKAALHNIIKGHTTFPYTASSTDVWDILKEADKDPNDPSKVVGIYSGFSMDAAAEYNSGQGWNREHVWAKSRGDFGESRGAGTDCHHLRAADISTNSARSNRNFDYADQQYIDASGAYNGPTDSRTSSSDYVWEPRDEVKGDVARMIFYMATRYEQEDGYDLELSEDLQDKSAKAPFHSKLSVLLEWHQLDPVSDAERTRNDIIYSYQKNRNPYIDHPEFVCLIYSCDGSTPTNTAPTFTSTAIAAVTVGETYQYSISVTDAEADVIAINANSLPSWLSLTDIGDGTALLSGSATAAELGAHVVEIVATDGELSASQSFTIIVNEVNTGSNENAADLFISEYIEGSSFNKGLEIANFTGVDVDLSNYSLFKQTNGAGEWGTELVLSGTLLDGELYVVVNSQADPSMQAAADLVTGVAAVTFNGNDPVALFKNGVLIDVLGIFNNAADFAKDVTLVRKPDITSPNSTYTPSEWETLTTDTFSDIGSHIINLGTGGADTEMPSVPQNLQVADLAVNAFTVSWDAATDNVGVENYTVYLDGTEAATIDATSFVFTGLTAATSYEVNVVANDASGNSSTQSNALSVTTLAAPDTEAPTAPQNVQVSNVTESAFDLSWDAATDNVGVTLYEVFLDSESIATVSSPTYSFTNAIPATTYLVNIVAEDASGNTSAESTTISVTTANSTDTEAPSQVVGLVASNVSNTGFRLEWSAASDNVGVTSYDLYLDNTFVTAVTARSYDFTGLLELTTYGVTVVAKDLAGNESLESAVLSVSTAATPDVEAPSTPQGLSASNITNTAFMLAWNPSTDNVGVIYYEVYLDNNVLATTPTAAYSFTNLQAALTYDVYVIAVDEAINKSTRSATLSVTTLALPDTESPTSPINLVADFVGINSATIAWQAATDNIGVSAYKIYIDGVEVGESEQLNYTFLGLNEGTTYTLGAAAIDASANQSSVSTITITTNTTQSQAPVVISESFFELGWDDWVAGGNNAAYYSGSYAYEGNNAIRITDDNGLSSSMTSIELDVNNFNQLSFEFYFYSNRMDYGDQFEIAYFDGQIWNTISTFTEGIDFTDRGFYIATVYVDRGYYTFPQNGQFRIQGLADNRRDQLYFDQVSITGIISENTLRQTNEGLLTTIEKIGEEVSVLEDVNIYPNPSTTGYLQISKEYDDETEVSIIITDLKGNTVYQSSEMVREGIYQPVLDLSSLKAGMYFLQLKDTLGGQEIRKIIIR